MRVILDTNFLMAATQFKTNIFSGLRGHKVFVSRNIIRELNELSSKKGKNAKAAKIALQLIKRKGLKVLISKERNTDKSLIQYSKRGYVIATQDRALRDKIKKSGAKVIYIRQKKYLELEVL